MAGLKDIWICSLRPDMALMVITGEPSVLIAPSLEEYKGKLAIHAAACVDEDDRKESYKRIIELGWSPEDVPEGSLVGWCKIGKNCEYNANTFAADFDKHCYSSREIEEFKQNENWEESVHGLYLKDMQILKMPIMGIGKLKNHGEWWTADNPFDLLCLKKCFDAEALDLQSIL